MVQNRLCEIVSGAVPTHISGPDFSASSISETVPMEDASMRFLPFADNIVDTFRDSVGMLIETQMTQQHRAGE